MTVHAEREILGPASLSILATRSSESNRDVFPFIAPLYYQSRVLAIYDTSKASGCGPVPTTRRLIIPPRNQRRLAWAPFALLLTCRLFAGETGQGESVWFWFANCGARALVLDVKLDGATLYSSTIPICQATRDGAESQGESRKVSFPFRPHRAIKWSGYRDSDVTTDASRPLHVDLWQAGADPNDLLIGVSVSDGKSIYMNTIYIAYPEKRSSTEIATGLVISTRPASSDAH
jgi:hypothetical protein